MPVHVLKERTYLDPEGKATTDEKKAASLLGIENDEITQEAAQVAGLIKHAKAEDEVAPAGLLYYDTEGNRVAAGSSEVAFQYLDNDPNRPDAGVKTAVAKAEKQADSEAQSAPTKAELLARADELGLEGFNARSKNADIAAAVAKAAAAE